MAGASNLAHIAGPLPPNLDIVSDALRILCRAYARRVRNEVLLEVHMRLEIYRTVRLHPIKYQHGIAPETLINGVVHW